MKNNEGERKINEVEAPKWMDSKLKTKEMKIPTDD